MELTRTERNTQNAQQKAEGTPGIGQQCGRGGRAFFFTVIGGTYAHTTMRTITGARLPAGSHGIMASTERNHGVHNKTQKESGHWTNSAVGLARCFAVMGGGVLPWRVDYGLDHRARTSIDGPSIFCRLVHVGEHKR